MDNMSQLALINPVALPVLLNAAENKFVECMGKGVPCIIGGNRPDKPIDEGENANVIHADVIRFFAWGGNGRYQMRGSIIHLEGAWIPDQLDLTHAVTPFAFGLIGCHFAQPVVIRQMECRALYLDFSCLEKGLLGDGLTTKISLHMRGGMWGNFISKGKVTLVGANIGGEWDCSNGIFAAADKSLDSKVIHADEIKVGGSVLMSGGFCAKGAVRLHGARVEGIFDCSRGKFQADLSARAAEFKNALVLENTKGSGTINLEFAKTGALADGHMFRAGFKFFLNGFTYREFDVPGDVKSRIAWLDNRPVGFGFSPQPFEQAAKVLFAMGHNSDAREILLEKERRLTEQGKMSGWHKFGRRLWDTFAGYGYRLRKTLAWSAGIVLAGAAFFQFADNSCRIVPHQPVVLAHEEYKAAQTGGKCSADRRATAVVERLFPEYPRFNSLVYSADVFIPFFAMHQEPYWYPQPDDADADIILVLLPFWYWLEIIAGWLLTSLLVLTVTGLLRPRQSSGGGD